MEDFFKQLLIKILSYVVFLFIMLLISFSAMTGEFPPRFSSIKTQIDNLKELKQNYSLLLKKTAEKLKNSEAEANEKNSQSNSQKISITNQDANELSQLLKDIRMDQLRLHNQIETLTEQNKLLLQRLSPQPSK